MKRLDDKHLFFDMQEHPERYSDEQLEAMMSELDKEPDAEKAWRRFNPTSFYLLRKIAAVFLAAAFIGVLSFAGYRAFSFKTKTDNRQRTTDTLTVKSQRFVCEVHEGDTIFRFENIRLDSILAVISRHYDRQVVFRDKAPARLRLYMTCHTTQSLDEFVEMLNMFDGFKLSQKFDILFVDSDEKKEGTK